MINLGLLMKLAKGDLDPDLIAEALESMGMGLNFAKVEQDQVPLLCQGVMDRSAHPEAEVVRAELFVKSGGTAYALIVFSPAPPIVGAKDRAELPAGFRQLAEISA